MDSRKSKVTLTLVLILFIISSCGYFNENQIAFSNKSHPIFDIENFDSNSFTDTTDLFRYDVVSSISKNNNKDLVNYTLTITPNSDELYSDVTVTASLDDTWLDFLLDKNRNTLFFGTDRKNPIIIDRTSQSNKGLISDIGKYLEDEVTPEQVKNLLKMPIKIRIKYQGQIINQTITPVRIIIYGIEEPSI